MDLAKMMKELEPHLWSLGVEDMASRYSVARFF
jgi:hypothetical protein